MKGEPIGLHQILPGAIVWRISRPNQTEHNPGIVMEKGLNSERKVVCLWYGRNLRHGVKPQFLELLKEAPQGLPALTVTQAVIMLNEYMKETNG